MKITTLAPLTLVATLCATVSSADVIRTVPNAEMNWAVTPEGVAFAPLIGDRFVESYMAMVKLPAGLISPAHVKSADMFGLIVSGTMTHTALDNADDPVMLNTGAFYHIPAGIPHVSSCVSDQECVSFLYQDGQFDFLPVTN
ncbi:MAG: cupin domain-containing protein [Thalassovita sp.]